MGVRTFVFEGPMYDEKVLAVSQPSFRWNTKRARLDAMLSNKQPGLVVEFSLEASGIPLVLPSPAHACTRATAHGLSLRAP